MKKYLFTLFALLAAGASLRGAVVLNESFTYLDGVFLTNAPGGVWTIHSGSGFGPVIAGGKVLISQTNSPDVSAAIAGGPYSSPTLYASFVVNFSVLPLGAGNYFAHFKDDGIQLFRARVYATTNGTDGTKYRVGIANASSSTPTTIIATDLSLNNDYLLVVRYNTGTAASTLWINPSSESATGDKTDATDGSTVVGITRFALRESTSSGAGMGTLTIDNLLVGTAFTDVVSAGDPTKNPPFISNIPDQLIPKDGVTEAVPFYVVDGETPNGSLTVSFTSSNTDLVTVDNIALTSDGGSNRTVTVTPTPGEQGVSQITATVSDGDNNTATRNFLVIVGAPTISAIPSQTTPKDTPTPAIAFTVGDGEGDALTITAASTNGTLVPVSNISFGSSGGTSNITLTPSAGLSGLTRITVFVSDGFNTVSNSFVLTVFQTLGLDLVDTFDYPDGSVVTNSSFVWNTHSGTSGQAQVLGGRLFLAGTNSEDIHVFLANSPYKRGDGWILYASFQANFSSRPTAAAGDYFAHFKDDSASNFGGKVFAMTDGAGAGKVRLGVANSANSPSAVLPLDLDTNVSYTVIVRYNVGTGESKLWVNATCENDAGATATDSAFTLDVWTYSFRESSGIGNLSIDDLKIGTAFSDVLPVSIPPTLHVTIHAGMADLSWPAIYTGYKLQTSSVLPAATWYDVSAISQVDGCDNLVSTPVTADNTFFRLTK